jgi:hypothetical protein
VTGNDISRLKTDSDFRYSIRLRMKTDLFWLAKDILGYSRIEEETHREAVDIFVKKNPHVPFEQQGIEDGIRIRRRILLMPRKTYKTSLSISDSVQWILVDHEIAIMCMTASNSDESPLATAYVLECASHFVCLDDCEPGDCRHPLHICFPDTVLKKAPHVKATQFTIPGRKKFRRDPTLRAVSIEQSLSGWHPDIICGEDVQDNRNSQTAYGLKKVRTNFYINIKMLGESGMLNITGTRYGPADLYGDMIQKAGPETKLLWKPAYLRRPHALKLDEEELERNDVLLQFPKQLSWDFLASERTLDLSSYMTQYLNIAEGGFKATFPMEKLEAAKVGDRLTEREGNVHICWRLEYAECKYAAGAVGIEVDGRMTIVEVIRGQFPPTKLARKIAATAKKWYCHRVEIEETPGATTVLPHIRNEALELDWRLDVSWSEFHHDETARRLHIKAAEPHLLSGRLLFADSITNVQEVFRQLHQFGMIEEFEVASVISRIAQKLPASIAAKDFDISDDDQFRSQMDKDAYDRTYNRGKYFEEEPVLPEAEEVEWSAMQNEYLESEFMPGLSG